MSQPPATAAELAPTLAKAVSQSGLFYEAHQAQWLAGQRPLESLRAEPQGQLLPTARTLAAEQRSPATPASHAEFQTTQPGTGKIDTGPNQAAPTASTPSSTTSAAERATTNAATQSTPTTQTIPEEVRPLVQQQLDAVATQRLSWHGEVWPGQVMDWEIERDEAQERNARDETSDEAARWSTTLRLSMPQLGTVDATLQLAGNTLRLQMASTSDDASVRLRQQAPTLIQALADAGINLQSLDIRHET